MESSKKRKSTSEMEMESEMRRRKIKALEDHADFEFKIGPEKGSAELMRCFKSDLLAASEYFGGLLRSPSAENPPVWIKHIQPHIFKMILKFVSLQTVEEVLTLEDAVALALAADELLLDPLKDFCASVIKTLVTVETVWKTLNLVVRIPNLPDACSNVLSLKTKKCLEHESFLKASADSLIFLLDLETLAIDSELDLIDYSLKLAKTKPENEEVEMMKAVIPHLRLLALPVDQLHGELSKYLSDSQLAFLAKRLIFKDEIDAANVSPSLNLIALSRSRPKSRRLPDVNFKLEFIAEDFIKKEAKKMWSTSQIRFTAAEQALVLKGIEILTRANDSPYFDFVSNNNGISPRFAALNQEYQEDLVVALYVTPKGAEENVVFYLEIKSMKKYNSWFSVDFGKKVLVPKEAKCRVEVRLAKVYQLISPTHITENIEKAAKCEEFTEFKLSLFEREYGSHKKFKTKCLKKNGGHLFCIKSLSVFPAHEQGC